MRVRIAQRRPCIGVDFHVWDGIFQGSRSHLVGLYRAAIVQAPEFDFVFFLSDTEGLRQAYEEFRAPNVRLVSMRKGSGVWRLGVQLAWLRWRNGVDLLHMQYRLPLFPLGPCACTIHDLLFETHPQYFSQRFVWLARLSFRDAIRRASLLYTVSEFSKGELERLYGVASGRILVTVNGVNERVFFPGDEGADKVRALGLEPGEYVLTVGRLEPRKNHVNLLRAYALLRSSAPLLVIVGQRDFAFDGVFETLADLQLGDRVRLLENVQDDVVPALMRHARLFAYPAFAEGFGMPVAEAMASGVAVVTGNTTALPEVAGDGALTVPPDDVAAISDAIRYLLENPEAARVLALRGVRQAKRFRWEESARVLLHGMRNHFRARGRID